MSFKENFKKGAQCAAGGYFGVLAVDLVVQGVADCVLWGLDKVTGKKPASKKKAPSKKKKKTTRKKAS